MTVSPTGQCARKGYDDDDDDDDAFFHRQICTMEGMPHGLMQNRDSIVFFIEVYQSSPALK